ncbi:MFS transporter [uncultured Jatrophihabitans sp.]|uniref:MFS transporter n=1 Tax=uncultured Jatrophihabitans sp. TaxID=1610747 RepID=UPI0035CBCD88
MGTYAQAATCSFLYGMPLLVAALQDEGLSLVQAGVLVSAPVAGLLCTLILWGAAADRRGERLVIMTGVAAAAVLLVGASLTQGPIAFGLLLVLAGAAAGSVNAAGGRMVLGWFPVHERGLAMGTRQTAQPLGVALAALVLPSFAHAHGPYLALLFPAMLCAIAALLVFVFVLDPARPPAVAGAAPTRSPYRGSRVLVRVHASSALLVVPQFAVGGFTLVYLVAERHWDPEAAGRLVFGFQVAGAVGRVAAGVWSDRVRSRLRPMRQLAVASAALMVLIAFGAATGLWFVIGGFGLGAVITVADNGLAYVAVAEVAGREWSGRALGLQNTVQNVAAVATPPVLAFVVSGAGYAWGFALVAVFPLLAIPLTPVRSEVAAEPVLATR